MNIYLFFAISIFKDGTFDFSGNNDTYRKVPFRAIFNGVYQDSDGSVKNFAIEHDYHDFRLELPGERIFKVIY